jgi:hypothetical protein
MKNQERDIKEDFKDHVAVFSEYKNEKKESIHKLIWGNKNGSSIYKIIYIIQFNNLFVAGDVGEAVYTWSSGINFEFLSECGQGYFKSKCRASEMGTNFVDWDKKKASEMIREHAEEVENKEDMIQELIDNSDTQEGMMYWIENNRNDVDDVFGSDWWEFLPSVGEVIHPRCLYHLIGIKMAMEK